MRAPVALVLVTACAGCAPAGTFSRAPLPGASRNEIARVTQYVGAANEASLLRLLKVNFYKAWLTEFGPDAVPPTVVNFHLNPSDAVTLDTVAAGMADDEGSISALLLLQFTPEAISALSQSLSVAEVQRFGAIVNQYQAPVRHRIERVGARIAAVANRADITFTLDPAFGLNAGAPHALNAKTVFVGPQIVLLTESDDELAAVLGHEVAHITQGHTRAGAIRDAVVTTLQVTAMVAVAAAAANSNQRLSQQQLTASMVGAAALTGLAARGAVTASGYTRDNERDADYYGIQLATAAGYDSVGAARVFTKLAMLEKGLGGQSAIPFLVDHPGGAERVVRAVKEVGRLRARDGDFFEEGLGCWTVSLPNSKCTTCCSGTSICLNDCG